MSLQAVTFFKSDTTGAVETVTLKPVAPKPSTNAMIASAFYGTDASGTPKAATRAPDGKSVSFTVLSGINSLVVTIVSPDPADETVNLSQGAVVLADPTVRNHSAVSTMLIQGT